MRTPAAPSRAWLHALPVVFGGVGFVFIPVAQLKFFCLGGFLWGVGRSLFKAQTTWPLALALAATYTFAFLFNPVCFAPFLRPAGWPAALTAGLWQVLLTGCGCAWLWLILNGGAQWPRAAAWPNGRFVLLWLLALLVLHTPAWGVDVSYGGDEHYHMTSAETADAFGSIILSSPVGLGALVVWVVAGFILQRLPPDSAGARGRRWAWWGMLGLGLAGVVGYATFPDPEHANPLLYERTVRYPAAEPWLSALVTLPCFENWGQQLYASFALLRFVPMLALFAMGVWLGGDPRWCGRRPTLVALGVTALATVPTLLYHGTMLYLELPAVFLGAVVLGDAKRWVFARPGWLMRRPCWLAALLIGFTKETGVILVILLWVAREVMQSRLCWRAGRGFALMSRREGRLSLALLGPACLYLALRTFHEARPYEPHLGTLAAFPLWWQAGQALIVQFGAIWLFAALGAAWWLKRRRWCRLGLCLVALDGLGMFHFLEDPRWIGLARFNLLLLAPVLVLAKEGLAWLVGRHELGGWLAATGLLVANLLTSPVDWHGGRRPWDNSGERWYNYTQCLTDLKAIAPRSSSVIFGNMPSAYGVRRVTDRVGWRPESFSSQPPVTTTDDLVELERTLGMASLKSADFVVYRTDNAAVLGAPQRVAGYDRLGVYPARVGGLILWRRTTGENLAPTERPARGG